MVLIRSGRPTFGRSLDFPNRRVTRGFMRRLPSSSDGLINKEDRTDQVDQEIDASVDRGLADVGNHDHPTYREPIERLAFLRKRSTRSWLDRTAIMAQSHRDRDSIEPQSWLNHGQLWHTITANFWPTIILQSWPPISTYSRIKWPEFFG